MGKGADRVKAPEQLEREVTAIREHMEPVIAELDHRRHALLDWRAHLRRRGPALAGIAAVVIGGVLVARARRRRRNERLARSWW